MSITRKKYPIGTLIRVINVEYKTEDFQRFMSQFIGLVGPVSGILPDGEVEVTFKDNAGQLQMCFDDDEIEIITDKHERFLYQIYGTNAGQMNEFASRK